MISIAIDGPSGVGKSSIARKTAQRFGFMYVDTGAIYRTIALAVKNLGLDARDKDSVIPALDKFAIDIAYTKAGEQRMLLDGKDVSTEIRSPEMALLTSIISSYPEVRTYLLDMQRNMAKKFDVIMDGRDIGTVILPDAELKIFLTASAEERARRRFEQMSKTGTVLDYDVLLQEMKLRDEQDKNRSASPLVAAEDAVIIDSSNNTQAQTIDVIAKLITEKTGRMPKTV